MSKKAIILFGAVATLSVVAAFFFPITRAYISYWLFSEHTAATQKGEAVVVGSRAVPNMLYIPTLGIEAPIVESLENTESAYQEALQSGVVRHPQSAQVGTVGNAYIFGHSSDYIWSGGKYKTVFALLPQIQIGAPIFVTDSEGIRYEYRVFQKMVVSPTDTWVLDSVEGAEYALTLQTSYPLGTALKRYIVRAKLWNAQ